jgi:SNF2 family DNA or RNA helicase
MDVWTIMAPVMGAHFDDPSGRFAQQVVKIPGIRVRKGKLEVPQNALNCMIETLQQTDGSLRAISWMVEPREPAKWQDVEAKLREVGEVRPFVLDGFLMPYQQEAVEFGWSKDGVHFWHPTGSGKTLTGIISGLSVEGALVIVTRAASRLQYGREIEKFTNLRAYVMRPASKMTKKSKSLDDYVHEQAYAGKRMVIVVAWAGLKDSLEALSKLNIGAVIFDEAHRGKNSKRWDVVHLPPVDMATEEGRETAAEEEREAKTKKGFIKDEGEGRMMFVPHISTASCAAKLSRMAHKRICTTATPIKDRVRDLYAQLDLAEPNAWGSTTAWMDRYADRKPGTYGGYDTRGSSNIPELNERLKLTAHILDYRETHRQLPPKRRQSVYVAPEDQNRPSAGFAAQLRKAAKRGPGAVLEVKLARSASMKQRAVMDLVESHVGSNQKVVIFTGRKADCEKLGEKVRKNSVVKSKGADVWSAHGGTSTKARQQIIDDYMSHPGPCVLVGTGHAFGESLNIHDTDAALFVMLPYDPGQLRQWEGRFTRLGQRRPVVIYYVIAEGTVDERVASILIDKLPAVAKIAQDTELAEAGDVLAGFDDMDTDDFAESILADLDFG